MLLISLNYRGDNLTDIEPTSSLQRPFRRHPHPEGRRQDPLFPILHTDHPALSARADNSQTSRGRAATAYLEASQCAARRGKTQARAPLFPPTGRGNKVKWEGEICHQKGHGL